MSQKHSEWHALEPQAVTTLLEVDSLSGLSASQVNERALRDGPNVLQQIKSRPAWRVLVDQFTSIVIALLAFAAGVASLTGDNAEAIAILIVLVLNAVVGFVTEWQAGRALDALRRQSRTTSRVRRDNFEAVVDAEELVRGDIILNAGDRVPADARLLEAVRVETEESALTGESTTVEKSTGGVPVQTPLAERRSMLYLGTAIAAGRAVAVVVSTGAATQLRQIGRLVATATKERSPLEIQLANLGRRLVYLVLVVAATVMLTGWLRGDGLWLMVEVGISLAVAAVPESLPGIGVICSCGLLAISVVEVVKFVSRRNGDRRHGRTFASFCAINLLTSVLSF